LTTNPLMRTQAVSYLDSPRLHFRGWFQADVSTINNDVRMFQNASFVPEYQQLNQNGSWNPEGTAIFRILDCAVTGGFSNGRQLGAGDDPAIGMAVQNADRRAPGKLVDLDPQQQMVSEIWGMQVRLVNADLATVMQGEFLPAAFVNLWQKQITGVRRDQQLAACYQSVLEGVQWAGRSGSELLDAIAAASAGGLLSIEFNVFGYARDATIPRYTMGHIVGTIGPYKAGEPKHFTIGRQMISAQPPFSSAAGQVNTLQAKVAADGKSVTADFGNSFQIESANSGLLDIGTVLLGVLTTNPTQVLTTVDAGQVAVIGEVPYLGTDWYTRTAGLQTFDLTGNDAARAALGNCPLVVISPVPKSTSYTVLLQESVGGLYVRADQFVFRINPGVSQNMEFYASQFGVPLPGVKIGLSSQSTDQTFMGGSGGGVGVDPPTRPKAAIPDIFTPADGVTYQASATTNENGYASVNLTGNPNGLGTLPPRGYIAGQLYGINYQLANQPAVYAANPFNYISVLAYGKKEVPDEPTWYSDIEQLLTQYGNLYPIMGKYVVDLRDYQSVVSRVKILKLAFSLPAEDPNHMPVTRDLGADDRLTILKWLETKGPDGLPLLGRPQSDIEQPFVTLTSQPEEPELVLQPMQAAGKTAVIMRIEQRAARAAKKGESK
jgi:hypothetical protein